MKGYGTILIDWSIDEGGALLSHKTCFAGRHLFSFLPVPCLMFYSFAASVIVTEMCVMYANTCPSKSLFFIFPYTALLSVRGFGGRFFSFSSPLLFWQLIPRDLISARLWRRSNRFAATRSSFLFSIVHLQGFISIRSISHHRIKRLKINIVLTGGMAIVSPIQIGEDTQNITSRWKGKSNSQHVINISFEWGRSSWMGSNISERSNRKVFHLISIPHFCQSWQETFPPPPAQIKVVLPNIWTWWQFETYKERLERFSFPLIFLFFLLFLWYYRRLE